jgi:hypothetical protein
MIAYQELCDALARWREQHGMANGPSARMPQGPVVVPSVPTFEPAMTEEMHIEQPTTVGPNPLAAAPEPDADAPTGLHQPAPPRSDQTQDLELDSMMVLDDDRDI